MDLKEVREATTVRHPWEQARFDFFHKVLGAQTLAESDLYVLDVGAGDG